MSDGEDKTKLISELDPESYVAYIEDLQVREGDLEIRRGGQVVALK
jgi:hypothetical protein